MKTSQRIYSPFKRLIGMLGSFVGIIVCFAFLWWWVIPVNAIVTRGHPFFVQERYGKNKKIFMMIKFRSMRMDADPNLAPSDMGEKKQKSMETKFGAFLRKTSIDETPQLLNVFIGQMAFIGTRPVIDASDGLVTINKRKEIGSIALRPGISGCDQIHGRRAEGHMIKVEMVGYHFGNFNFLPTLIFLAVLFLAYSKRADSSFDMYLWAN